MQQHIRIENEGLAHRGSPPQCRNAKRVFLLHHLRSRRTQSSAVGRPVCCCPDRRPGLWVGVALAGAAPSPAARLTLRLSSSGWKVQRVSDSQWQVKGTLSIRNPHRRMEVFVPEIELKPTLLGRADLSGVNVRCSLSPQHPDEEARADGYWFAYIVKGRKTTKPKR